jgi:sugar lactone lactonase YvrE
VSTFAGAAGQPGSADGPSGAARFNNPRGIAIDPAGDLYVGDTGNHTIRRITSAGEVSTLAGSAGVPGTADGVGGAAGFSFPGGVALDGLGNLYVADTDNHTIRRIALPGTVSTLAGTAGIGGVTDGMGTTAQFHDPGDVVADSAGNVYVADSSNHIIRKITPAGDVTTFAGTANAQGAEDGTGAAARFSYPWGIARDAAGTLYVAEGPANHTIRKVTAGAEVTTLAGAAELSGRVDAQGPLARFVNPQALAVGAAGNVYVAEGGSNVPLRAIDAAANVTSVAGTVGLSSPGGLARDAAGNLYVADTNNHVIRKVDPGGSMTVLAGMAGSPGSADGAALSATFNAPRGVAIHQATGIVYVADTDNHTIRAISPMGQVTTLAGTAGSRGSADGNGAAARFRFPNDLACDAAGSLYVADRVNNTIRKITPSGEVTTFAGSASSAGFTDGTGPDARFNFPFGIGIDALGNLFVADANNHAVRKITQSALVTTVVGAPGKIGVQLGALPASLFSPRDVAVRPDGQLLIVTANGVVVTQGF